jgi:hypothetical protein
LTVAVHCEVALTITVDGLHATCTEVMVEGDDCTVRAAVPDLVGSWVLVAVTVAVPAEDGAVKTPLALMTPLLADHVTAELYVPVPFTIAVHCEVALTKTAAGVQAGETEVIVGDEGGGPG